MEVRAAEEGEDRDQRGSSRYVKVQTEVVQHKGGRAEGEKCSRAEARRASV